MMNMYKVEQSDNDHNAYLKEAMDRFSNNEPDIFIVSKEGYKIYTQRSLLSLYSGSMCSLLSSVSCCVSTSISLPVNSNVINNLLRILYKGVATAYDEKDLALVSEAAELMGITLGDFNIKGNKHCDDNDENNVGENDENNVDEHDEHELLSIEHVQEVPGPDNGVVQLISDSNNLLLSDNENPSLLLNENLPEEISDNPVTIKAEVLNEVLLGDDEQSLDVMEIEEQTEDKQTISNLEIIDDGVKTLVEEVERMGANIETLAEEVGRIDEDKDNVEERVKEDINISSNETIASQDTPLELLYENVSPNDKRFVYRDLKCDICQNTFKRPQGLLRHKQKFHKDENKLNSTATIVEQLPSDEGKEIEAETEISCKYCAKVFRSAKSKVPINVAKANLKRHMDKKHENENVNEIVADSTTVKDSSKRKGADSLGNVEPYPKITKTSAASSSLCENLLKESASNITPEPSSDLVKTPVTAVIAPVVRDSKLSSYENKKENAVGKFSCTKCNKSFDHKDNFESHLPCCEPKASENLVTEFKCNICGKSFEKMDRLQLHQSYHSTFELSNGSNSSQPSISSKTGGTYACDKCDKRFDVSHWLKKHKLKCHPIIKQEDISPPSASINTKTKRKLDPKDKIDKINEMLNCVVKKEKPSQSLFPCEKCSETFYTMNMLKTHRKTTHGSYECVCCDKSFETEKDLSRHMSVHISNTNPDKSISTPVESSTDKTGPIEDQTEDDSSNYLCTLCDLEFVDENELFAHTSIHTVVTQEEEKVFSCRICDRDFDNEKAMKKHNKAHTEEILLKVKTPSVDMTKNNVLCIKDCE